MDELRELAAASLDARAEWWEWLPHWLTGLPALGGDAALVARLLADLPAGARVLDLGCGSGGVSLTLARRGAHVLGIDAHEGLVEQARRRARRAGLGARCTHEVGDLRAAVRGRGGFDAVLLVAVGPLFGGERATARALAANLRPGGRCVYEWDWSEATARIFEEQGLRVRAIVRGDSAAAVARESALQARIRANAEALARRRPDARPACEAYLAAQAAALERAVAGATWLFEACGTAAHGQ